MIFPSIIFILSLEIGLWDNLILNIYLIILEIIYVISFARRHLLEVYDEHRLNRAIRPLISSESIYPYNALKEKNWWYGCSDWAYYYCWKGWMLCYYFVTLIFLFLCFPSCYCTLSHWYTSISGTCLFVLYVCVSFIC